MARIVTIWPAGKNWRPGGSWRQSKRWLVLDVTGGLGSAMIIARCEDRARACAESLRLREAGPSA